MIVNLIALAISLLVAASNIVLTQRYRRRGQRKCAIAGDLLTGTSIGISIMIVHAILTGTP